MASIEFYYSQVRRPATSCSIRSAVEQVVDADVPRKRVHTLHSIRSTTELVASEVLDWNLPRHVRPLIAGGWKHNSKKSSLFGKLVSPVVGRAHATINGRGRLQPKRKVSASML